jgi:hypothetical protein
MRLLEMLLLIVLALTLVAIPLTWTKRPKWLRFLAAFPAIVMLLQIVIEGYRWQMAPAYALTTIVFLAGLPTMIKGQQPSATPQRASRALAIIGCFVGLVIVWITIELSAQVPAFKMPVPGGPYAIGTRTFLLVDESRIDEDSPINNGYRTMSIQAWYPAELNGEEEPTSYIQPDIRQEMEELNGPPAWYNSHLDRIRTHAYWKASIAQSAERFPVILYSPSGNASLHKILFEELASRGYLVVSISHPHWSNVLFGDQGMVIPQGGLSERYMTWFEEARKPTVGTAQGQINSVDDISVVERAQINLNRARPIAISELRQWAEDVGFVLDQLSEMNQPGEVFNRQLDLSQVGVMGFSLGGATAGQFCTTDARCQAGINVDGFMFGDILDTNLKVPFMFFHSSSPGVEPVGVLFYEWAENDAYLLQVAGSNHHDLGAPAPTGRPIILQLGLSSSQFPDGAYLAQVMNEYISAFFDKHLKNKPAALLDGPSPYPEVMFMKKGRN